MKFKAIIEVSMVSTTERFTDNSPMSPRTPIIVKKCIARESLRLLTEVLDVKKKTAVCRIGAAKSKCKAIIAGFYVVVKYSKEERT